jgi:hypothetical protein
MERTDDLTAFRGAVAATVLKLSRVRNARPTVARAAAGLAIAMFSAAMLSAALTAARSIAAMFTAHRMMAAWLIAVSFTAASTAHAQAVKPLAPAEAAAIRTVIESQIAAFRADDAPLAFSYAAPDIRAMFGSPDNFMRMVRQGYPVVYRPVSMLFRPPVDDAGEFIQAVELSDRDGVVWLALYRMQKTKEGSDAGQWRIAGVVLTGTRERAT